MNTPLEVHSIGPRRLACFGWVCVLATNWILPSSGQPIVVNNPSFEEPATPLGTWTEVDGPASWNPGENNAISGWGAFLQGGDGSMWSNAGVQDQGVAADGLQMAYINGGQTVTNQPNNALFQVVGGLSPNTTYTLTVACGGHPTSTWGSGGMGMIALVNGTNNFGTLLGYTVFGPVQGGEALADCTATYRTGPVVQGYLTIVLAIVIPGVATNTYQVDFDNVRLNATPLSWQTRSPSRCPGWQTFSGLGMQRLRKQGETRVSREASEAAFFQHKLRFHLEHPISRSQVLPER